MQTSQCIVRVLRDWQFRWSSRFAQTLSLTDSMLSKSSGLSEGSSNAHPGNGEKQRPLLPPGLFHL
jgi:hypothetical protein